jgi:hypothetical protein
MQKYFVNQQLIETLLASVKVGEITIPEIQCPFVWDNSNRSFDDILKNRQQTTERVFQIDNKPNTKCESDYQRHLYRNGTAGKSEDELCAGEDYGDGDGRLSGVFGDETEVGSGENKRVLF